MYILFKQNSCNDGNNKVPTTLKYSNKDIQAHEILFQIQRTVGEAVRLYTW